MLNLKEFQTFAFKNWGRKIKISELLCYVNFIIYFKKVGKLKMN